MGGAISAKFPIHDTHGIVSIHAMSIPSVSDRPAPTDLPCRMAKNVKMPDWGGRFRATIDEKDLSLSKIAERMGLAESTLRSWTNGHREPNVSEFLALCQAADVSAAQVLFGPTVLTLQDRKELGDKITAILEARPAMSKDYKSMIKNVKADFRMRKPDKVK